MTVAPRTDGVNRRRADKRARLNALKTERGCVDCGYNGHPAALHFDHVEPPTRPSRTDSTAISLNWSWERIEQEIAKCEVRCANCHAVRTAERGYNLGWHDHRRPHSEPEHGTRRCYDHGCRRPECVEAFRDYYRRYRESRRA